MTIYPNSHHFGTAAREDGRLSPPRAAGPVMGVQQDDFVALPAVDLAGVAQPDHVLGVVPTVIPPHAGVRRHQGREAFAARCAQHGGGGGVYCTAASGRRVGQLVGDLACARPRAATPTRSSPVAGRKPGASAAVSMLGSWLRPFQSTGHRLPIIMTNNPNRQRIETSHVRAVCRAPSAGRPVRHPGGSDRWAAPAGDGTGMVDFKGEKRSNVTHESSTDPDARRMRKGFGQPARLSYGGHVLKEDRHGLCVDILVTPSTLAEQNQSGRGRAVSTLVRQKCRGRSQ